MGDTRGPRLTFTPVLRDPHSKFVDYVQVRLRVAFRAEGVFPYTVTYTPPSSPLAKPAKMAQQTRTGVVVVCPRDEVETAARILRAPLEMTGSFGDLRVLQTDPDTKRVLFRCQLTLPRDTAPLEPRDIDSAVRALVAREVDKVTLTVGDEAPVKLTSAAAAKYVKVGVSYGPLFSRDEPIVAELEAVWTDLKTVTAPESNGTPYIVRYGTHEGAGLVAVDAARDPTQSRQKVRAFVVTCTDCACVSNLGRLMNRLGYHDNYDLFTIQGASLGIVGGNYAAMHGTGDSKSEFYTESFDKWDDTFFDMLSLSLKEHDVDELIVVDHIGCDSYIDYYSREGEDDDAPTSGHITQHFTNVRNFCKLMHPGFGGALLIKGYVMDADGALCMDPVTGEHDVHHGERGCASWNLICKGKEKADKLKAKMERELAEAYQNSPAARALVDAANKAAAKAKEVARDAGEAAKAAAPYVALVVTVAAAVAGA